MIHPERWTMSEIIWHYIHKQAELACLGLPSLALYDMLAPIHPKHERADHWPEGWTGPSPMLVEGQVFRNLRNTDSVNRSDLDGLIWQRGWLT